MRCNYKKYVYGLGAIILIIGLPAIADLWIPLVLKYKLPKEIILKLEPFIEMCLVQKKTCPKYKTLIKIYEDFLEEIK